MFLNFSNNPRPCFFVLSFLLSPTYAHFPPSTYPRIRFSLSTTPFFILDTRKKEKKRCKNCLSTYSTSLHVSEARSVKGVGGANKLQEEIKRGKKKKRRRRREKVAKTLPRTSRWKLNFQVESSPGTSTVTL